MKRKIISILLVLVLLQSYICTILAATQSELEQERREIKDRINDAENQKAAVNEQLDVELSEISKLDYEISEAEEELAKLDAQIEEKEASIEEKQKLIEQKQKEYDENEELLEQRIIVMYENGETSFLDLLFSSANIIDFISNYYMMSQLVQYDTELLQGIEKDKQIIEDAKKTLEDEKAEIEELRAEQASKTTKLKAKKAQRQEKANSLNAEQKSLQEQIDEYNEQTKKIEQQIRSILSEAGENAAGIEWDGSFIWPCDCMIITSTVKQRWGRWHKGLDIGASHEEVYASASGYAYNLENPGGYGNYILIVHGSGYMTLYGHLLERFVSDGEYVSQGETIAISGGGLTDEGRGSSTGRHLHFEIREATSVSNYFSNTFLDPLDFLPGGYTFAAGAQTPS